MPSDLSQYNRQAKIKTPFGGEDAAVLTRFTARESLSEPFIIVADVIVTEGADTIYEHLGAPISIEVQDGAGRSRFFHGRLWEISELNSDLVGDHYRLTLKPWASFLDINIESRMYQEKKVDDIVKDITGRRSGIGPKLSFEISANLPVLEYSVQWQESDYNFIARMFERHGMYYYYRHTAGDHEMIVTDEKASHTAVAGIDGAIEVLPLTQGRGRPGGAIWSLARRFEVAAHMATVTDYDFLTPTQLLTADKEATATSMLDEAKVAELYVHPGGFTRATGQNRGTQISERLVEAARVQSERCTAEGDAFAAAVGSTIEIKAGPREPAIKYLITATTHVYSGGKYRSDGSGEDELRVEMELIPAMVQFRPLLKTPRPRIYGPQTAVVAGPSGEEIETDQYGRIKVHFHWDRVQQGGATSSCWIRVAQSVAGANWGAFVLPRIGQEVVVEFLNGDPDAPLVTGAVYNGVNKPPYALPANKTRSTFKSRSTPQGSGFNELRIEDKAGSEEVFFNAEKDLNSIIDKGDETRTLNEGKRTTTIMKGDDILQIDKGNRKSTLDTGNDDVKIMQGNQTIKIDMGKQETEAGTSIELICGASSIKIEPAKITISSVNIEIKGDMSVKVQGVMVNCEATGINTVKGSLVKIN
jgi:type VI secretion system secreted protein VgrG